MASSNPAYPDAPPTAPGGMNQKALVTELVTKHGMAQSLAKSLTWPEMIDAVIQGRLDREREAKDDDVFAEFGMDDYEPPAEQHHGDGSVHDQIECDHPEHSDDLDPDTLLAEVEQAQAEAEAAKPPPLFIGMPHGLDYIFDGHMGAGPSGAERWMNCTASLGASRAFLETLTPNQQRGFATSGTAAREGTTAHAAAEVELRLMLGEITSEEAETSLLDLTVSPLDDEAYDDEMGEHITEYVDLIGTYYRAGREVLVEQRVEAAVPLIDLGPGSDPLLGDVYYIQGSADTVVLPTAEENVLVVADLKYGESIDVSVDENPQVRIYALGVLSLLADEEGNLPDIDRLDYHIVQPRLGGIKTWSESVYDLLEWRDEVLSPALTYALNGTKAGATFVPSEKACQWCPARGSCAALAESRIEAGAELFDTIVEAEFDGGPGAFPETGSLDNDRLGRLLTQIEGLTKIRDDLKAEAERRLHRGQQIPGFRLVNYTPPRKWTEGAQDKITHEVPLPAKARIAMFKPPALLTPKQALEALKIVGVDEPEAVVGELIESPPKRPVIGRTEGDRRKTWEGRPPEEMFDEIGDE